MLKATAQSRSLDFIGHVVETHLRLTCCTGGGGPADEPAEQQLSEVSQ
jgi:hypothetical protein